MYMESFFRATPNVRMSNASPAKYGVSSCVPNAQVAKEEPSPKFQPLGIGIGTGSDRWDP